MHPGHAFLLRIILFHPLSVPGAKPVPASEKLYPPNIPANSTLAATPTAVAVSAPANVYRVLVTFAAIK